MYTASLRPFVLPAHPGKSTYKAQILKFGTQHSDSNTVTPQSELQTTELTPRTVPNFVIGTPLYENSRAQTDTSRPVVVLNPEAIVQSREAREFEFSFLPIPHTPPNNNLSILSPAPENSTPPSVNRWDAAFIATSLASLGGGIPLFLLGLNRGGFAIQMAGSALTTFGGFVSLISIGHAIFKHIRQQRFLSTALPSENMANQV